MLMNYNEMKQAVELLDKEWDLGKKEAEADTNMVTSSVVRMETCILG